MTNIVTTQMVRHAAPETKIPSDWVKLFEQHLPAYNINQRHDVAMFLAQTAHESSGYTRLEENLNYSWQGLRRTFGKYYPSDALAKAEQYKPKLIANRCYGGRLGNIKPGDGYLFRGRGIIMLTGRNNYNYYGKLFGMTAEELAANMVHADIMVQVACSYWRINGLSLNQMNVEQATKKINGGYNGLEDRKARYTRIITSFGK